MAAPQLLWLQRGFQSCCRNPWRGQGGQEDNVLLSQKDSKGRCPVSLSSLTAGNSTEPGAGLGPQRVPPAAGGAPRARAPWEKDVCMRVLLHHSTQGEVQCARGKGQRRRGARLLALCVGLKSCGPWQCASSRKPLCGFVPHRKAS